MGLLVDGTWADKWYETKDGKFERQDAIFRRIVSRAPNAEFAPEAGRYHLYVSHACPWAHRTLIFRKLKKLEAAISMSVVNPLMFEHGWTFEAWKDDEAVGDPIHNASYMHEIYTRAKSDYTGRVTVPVLWDKQKHTIVNNESSELIRFFNDAFDDVGDDSLDFYPEDLRDRIHSVNAWVYHDINNGVYKSGFATTQQAYEKAVTALFASLDRAEGILAENPYLCGDRLTEADWRLFTTLLRFDPVYVGHFKCNVRRIADYPNLSNYLRALYQVPGIADTCHMDHIKQHYYRSHPSVNPTRIVPYGPVLDLDAAHNRPAVVLPKRR